MNKTLLGTFGLLVIFGMLLAAFGTGAAQEPTTEKDKEAAMAAKAVERTRLTPFRFSNERSL